MLNHWPNLVKMTPIVTINHLRDRPSWDDFFNQNVGHRRPIRVRNWEGLNPFGKHVNNYQTIFLVFTLVQLNKVHAYGVEGIRRCGEVPSQGPNTSLYNMLGTDFTLQPKNFRVIYESICCEHFIHHLYHSPL